MPGGPLGTDTRASINDYVIFGGAVEILGGWVRDFDDMDESFIVLDTAEFDFEIQVNDWSTAVLIVEYDSGEDVLFQLMAAFLFLAQIAPPQ